MSKEVFDQIQEGMQEAKEFVSGKWVPDEDMLPEANILGRKWKSRDGKISGTYTGEGSIPSEAYLIGIDWYFTSEQCSEE